MTTTEWRRADLGDVPELGAEIALCIYRAHDTSVTRWRRMRVEVAFGDPVRLYGPGLPSDHHLDDWPERPEQINGTALFWRPYEETIT